MAKYRLLGGSYRSNGVAYKKGEVVSSNRELDRVFVGMFEKLSETVTSNKQPTSPSSEGAGKKDDASAPFEKDVTKQFSTAKKIGGIKIIRVTDGDKEHYNIIDSGNGHRL